MSLLIVAEAFMGFPDSLQKKHGEERVSQKFLYTNEVESRSTIISFKRNEYERESIRVT